MYILMISRGIPSKQHPQWGCFEKDQAEALATIGHRVIVMSVDARWERHRGSLGMHHELINGVEYYNYIVPPAKIFIMALGYDRYINLIKTKYYKKVYKTIEKTHGKPDIIYTQFFGNTVMGVKLKEMTNIPVVCIEHLARFNNTSLSKQDKKWASFAFENADGRIAVSRTLATNLENHFNKRFEVVHNMYGIEFETTIDFTVWDSTQPLTFISAASLVKRKGFDTLIKAFAQARLPKDKWQLKIIGWGEEYENLKNLIKENGLDTNIHLMGKMDKEGIVKEQFQSQVYILPSRNENFSVAILEGLAMGLPVLATDCGGIRECLNDKNGIIVPVDDVKAMTNAISYMTNNYTSFDRKRIIEDCRERFSPKAVANKLTEIFQQIFKTKQYENYKIIK